jgi:hypothetical protein
MQFGLSNSAAANGVLLAPKQSAMNIPVSQGIFAVSLNFGNQFTGEQRTLQPEVKCASDPGFTALPRVALNAVPYAIGLMPGATVNANIPFATGNAVFKSVNTSNSGGTALLGQATAATGNTAGVYGTSSSPDGAGIWGANTGGTAVRGDSTQGAGVVGTSINWVGVYGTSTAQAGVWGNSTNGYGVYGESTNQDAVHGLSHEPYFSGVAGFNDSANGIGVYGNAPNGLAARFDNKVLVQSPAGTLPLVVKQGAAESQAPDLAVFETNNGTVGSLSAAPGIFVVGAASGKALGLNVNNGTRAVTIGSDGNVGVGTNNISARLTVHGPTGNIDALAFRVEDQHAESTLSVYNNGTVAVGILAPSTTSGLCANFVASHLWFIAACSSAAEYVPTVEGDGGFPETGDIVSIVPDVANPYGDDHSPFVVTQSTEPCDPNLLGFITNPAKGADGEKKNDHYLPLGIYGYFPAKVTTENGAIRRGDALTSSSKPGFAMKATQACKIIGYALEDADQDGTIQVFANTGESAAPEVAALRSQVDQLTQTVADLQQENAALDQRLTALEQAQSGGATAARGQAAAHAGLPSQAVLLGVVMIAGLVVVRRADRRGSK